MKLRGRFQLYLFMASLVPLLFFLWFFLNTGYPKYSDGFLTQKFFSESMLRFLVALAIVLVVIWLSGLYFKSVINRIKELTDYFRLYPSEDLPDLKPDPCFDELGKLRQSLIDMFQRIKQNKLEFENRYRTLLLSNMNLEEKYARSYTIQLILEEVSRELDSDQLLKKTADIIMGVFGSKRCTIYMADEETECLAIKADSGFSDSSFEKAIISLDSDNIIARSWRAKRVFTEADAKTAELKILKSRNTESFHVFPLTGRRGGLGVIVIEHEIAGGFAPDLVDFAKLIAQEISLSVENAYLYEKMKQMANHDALTGIYNRTYLMTYMAEVFAKDPQTVSVIMLDLDHFKKVNDKYGHLAGDMVLKTAALIIQKLLPAGILGRYGGEEFVVLLPEVAQEEAFHLADAIRQKISEHHFITGEGVKIPVTLSAGLANYPSVSDSFKSLLQLADDALYEAKNSGRNRVCLAVSNLI